MGNMKYFNHFSYSVFIDLSKCFNFKINTTVGFNSLSLNGVLGLLWAHKETMSLSGSPACTSVTSATSRMLVSSICTCRQGKFPGTKIFNNMFT